MEKMCARASGVGERGTGSTTGQRERHFVPVVMMMVVVVVHLLLQRSFGAVAL